MYGPLSYYTLGAVYPRSNLREPYPRTRIANRRQAESAILTGLGSPTVYHTTDIFTELLDPRIWLMVGFEEGPTASRDGVGYSPHSDIAADVAVQGSTTHGSSVYALRMHTVSTPSNTWATLYPRSNTGASETMAGAGLVWWQQWVRFDGLPTGIEPFMCKYATGSKIHISVRLTSAGSINVYGGTYDIGGGTIDHGSNPPLLDSFALGLATNTWHFVELQFGEDTSTWTLCVNGTTAGSGTADLGPRTSAVSYSLGDPVVRAETVDFSFYFDDIVMSANRLPSDYSIVNLSPDGDGNYTGGSGTYATFDEIPPDDDTTYTQLAATYKQTATLENLSDTRNIYAVTPWVHVKKTSATATTLNVLLRSNTVDSASDALTVASSTAYKSFWRVMETDPGHSGARWEASTINSGCEVGVIATSGADIRMTAAGLMVLQGAVLQDSSHTTDVQIYGAINNSHTTDVLKKGIIDIAQSVDIQPAVLVDKTHTTDLMQWWSVGYLHSTDVDIFGSNNKTHTTDIALGFDFAHTLDTLLSGDQVVHTTDVKIATAVSANYSHTTSMAKWTVVDKGHTTDVDIKGEVDKTHTTSTYTVTLVELTHTTDSKIFKVADSTISTDTVLKATVNKTHTTDILNKGQVDKTHTTDTYKVTLVDKTHTSDLLKKGSTDKTHTTSIWLQPTYVVSKTHTTDVRNYVLSSLTHTIDSFLKAKVDKTHSIDSLLKGIANVTHRTDTRLVPTLVTNIRHSADVYPVIGSTKTHTTDAYPAAQTSVTHTLDMFGIKTLEPFFTTDVVVKILKSRSHTSDTSLKATVDMTHTVDVLKKVTNNYTHTNDTTLFGSPDKTHSSDVDLFGETTVVHTTNVLLKTTSSYTYTTDVAVVNTQYCVHSSDTMKALQKSTLHTTTASVGGDVDNTYSSDTYLIVRTTYTHSVDSMLMATVSKTHTCDALLALDVSITQTTDIYLGFDKRHTTDIDLFGTNSIQQSTDVFVRGAQSGGAFDDPAFNTANWNRSTF